MLEADTPKRLIIMLTGRPIQVGWILSIPGGLELFHGRTEEETVGGLLGGLLPRCQLAGGGQGEGRKPEGDEDGLHVDEGSCGETRGSEEAERSVQDLGWDLVGVVEAVGRPASPAP